MNYIKLIQNITYNINQKLNYAALKGITSRLKLFKQFATLSTLTNIIIYYIYYTLCPDKNDPLVVFPMTLSNFDHIDNIWSNIFLNIH